MELSENEGKVVSASGHLFLIENGIRRWLSTPPDDYICTDGTEFKKYCLRSGITQEEWFSMRTPVSLGE